MQFNLQVFTVCWGGHSANGALVRNPSAGPAAVFDNWCWGGKWPGQFWPVFQGSSAAFPLDAHWGMPFPLCGSNHRSCPLVLAAEWHPRSTRQVQSAAGSFGSSYPVTLLPLGIASNRSPHWKGQSRGYACVTWLCLPGYIWLDGHPRMARPEADRWEQSGPQQLACGSTELPVRVLGAEEERWCGVGPAVGLSAASALMRKLVGQRQQEAWGEGGAGGEEKGEGEGELWKRTQAQARGAAPSLAQWELFYFESKMFLYSFSQLLHLSEWGRVSSLHWVPCLESLWGWTKGRI